MKSKMYRLFGYDIMFVRHDKIIKFINEVALISDKYKELESENEGLKQAMKKFEDSFNYVVILLGAFFGFRKFYDNYYEALNLRFYKGFKQKQTTTPEHKERGYFSFTSPSTSSMVPTLHDIWRSDSCTSP